MPRTSGRFTFHIKIGVAIALVAAFDWLFPSDIEGVSVGLFAFAWMIGLVLAQQTVRRWRRDIAVAFLLAAVCALALLYDPGPLAWALFWCALSCACLLPRARGFDDAWCWTIRLLLHAITGVARPLIDLHRLLSIRPRRRRNSLGGWIALLALPVVGTALFTALFALANPIIAQGLAQIRLPPIDKMFEWTLVVLVVWPALRPHALVTRVRIAEPGIGPTRISLASVLVALGMFNAVFALQNGLDIAFLWSGAPLPPGMTLAEYVHRGAYPLIVTALLAGLLVLLMLRPGTPPAANKLARWLVALWVAQNILLVASSALRTIDYVAQYELTTWRIAALLWMALVATGLALICWRIWFGKSARWLINANAVAAAAILIPCCFVDLSAGAAQWNVRHAREAGGASQPIDLCYLAHIGPPALLPLIELEKRPLAIGVRARLVSVRSALLNSLIEDQSNWWSWTPHGAMRLTRAMALLGPNPVQSDRFAGMQARYCANENDQTDTSRLTETPAQ